MKQMGCTEVTPLARLGVFIMSEVAREDNALMNYVFSPKACVCFSGFRYGIPRFWYDCLSARGQARIESYEQMLELIDLAEEDSFFD